LSICLAVAAFPVFAQNEPKTPVPAPKALPIIAAENAVNHPAVPDGPALVFDAESKEYKAKSNEAFAPFTFYLTNVWTNEIIITQVHASCGCTTAKLPETPWHLPPGGKGAVEAKINLAGKRGIVTKTLTFFTSVGKRVVMLTANIAPPPNPIDGLSPEDRQEAMAKASADPQAIFRGDCASCHVNKGTHSFGVDLYVADCGICHESPHRASSVPDLHALKEQTGLEFWKTIITYGKPHTMMPAFAQAQGGPLSIEQIDSLAACLDRTISHHFSTASAAGAP
jgi:mono/diheme cytochrome c family protein